MVAMKVMGPMALALLAAGCAYSPPAPFIVVGSETAVSGRWENSTLDAAGVIQAAEKHCARYGLDAEFAVKVSAFEVLYRCV